MRITLLLTVLVAVLLPEVYLLDDNGLGFMDEACNCDHCFKTNAESGDLELSSLVIPLMKEDTDADGRLIICARARDLPDQSFSSVCHMLCYNRCTRYNVTEVVEDSVKRNIVTAYRTNYYKLRDGPCKKI